MTIPFISGHYAAGAADGSDTVLSLAALSDRLHVLHGLKYSYSAAPTRGGLTIRLGTELFAALNPGFEIAGAGGADIWASWTETAGDGALANETTLIRNGVDAAKTTAGISANTLVYQDITVVAGSAYTLSFWTRGDATNAGRYLVYDNDNAADIISLVSTAVVGTTYTKVTAAFTVPAGCTSIRVLLYCPAANGGIAYFDDVSLGLSSAVPTIVFQADITAAGKGEINFESPRDTGKNTPLVITLGGGGGTIRGRLAADLRTRA